LSAQHAAYNPLSYQRGSVWPHDSLLAAAGMFRYGLHDEAATVIRGVLDAASSLEDGRLPELLCGIERALGAPVPYSEASIPQAWAAASPLLAAQLFVGLVPDAPRGRCFVSPWLPQWLDRLELDRLCVGNNVMKIVIARDGDSTTIEDIDAGDLEVVQTTTKGALWGRVDE
jgi:glycogen debranching enzyme